MVLAFADREDRIYLHIEILFRYHGMGKSSLYARIGEEGKGKGGLIDGRQTFVFVFAATRRMKNGLLCKWTCILEDVRDDDGLY